MNPGQRRSKQLAKGATPPAGKRETTSRVATNTGKRKTTSSSAAAPPGKGKATSSTRSPMQDAPLSSADAAKAARRNQRVVDTVQELLRRAREELVRAEQHKESQESISLRRNWVDRMLAILRQSWRAVDTAQELLRQAREDLVRAEQHQESQESIAVRRSWVDRMIGIVHER